MKILIVEDHSLYRDGIRQLFQQMGEEEVELLEAATCHEALSVVARHPDLDLVLCDIKLPDADGLEAMQRFLDTQPTLPMIILSASEDLAVMTTALERGAMGYIPKSTSAAVVLSVIKLVLSGGVYVPPEMLQKHALQGRDGDVAPVLTDRQREVLDLLIQGQSNKEIGNTLGLSLPTVKAHVSAIFKALNVKNRTQAVVTAKRANVARDEGID